MKKIIGLFLVTIDRLGSYFRREYVKGKFRKIGADTYIGKNCIFTPETIEIGADTYIGSNCVFQSSYGKICIGNHVMFGPGVHIHGGNHKIKEIGRYMKEASEKQPGDDGVVKFEDDCWIGSNAMILSNVTIGRGSVIGAGSIVTKDVPPYSIYTGAPEKKLRNRFTPSEITQHENLLQKDHRV